MGKQSSTEWTEDKPVLRALLFNAPVRLTRLSSVAPVLGFGLIGVRLI